MRPASPDRPAPRTPTVRLPEPLRRLLAAGSTLCLAGAAASVAATATGCASLPSADPLAADRPARGAIGGAGDGSIVTRPQALPLVADADLGPEAVYGSSSDLPGAADGVDATDGGESVGPDDLAVGGDAPPAEPTEAEVARLTEAYAESMRRAIAAREQREAIRRAARPARPAGSTAAARVAPAEIETVDAVASDDAREVADAGVPDAEPETPEEPPVGEGSDRPAPARPADARPVGGREAAGENVAVPTPAGSPGVTAAVVSPSAGSLASADATAPTFELASLSTPPALDALPAVAPAPTPPRSADTLVPIGVEVIEASPAESPIGLSTDSPAESLVRVAAGDFRSAPFSDDANQPVVAGPAAPAPTPAAPTPVPPPPPVAPAPEPLDERLLAAVRRDPADLAAQLDYHLALLAAGRPVPDAAVAAGLGGEDRDVLAAVLDGLTNFRSVVAADPDGPVSEKVRPIADLADRLAGQADLRLPAAALCSRVDGFGRYDPLAEAPSADAGASGTPRLRAGIEHPAVLYCEVDGFTSVLGDDRRWHTRLTWDAALYSDAGLKVWGGPTAEVADESRNRRRDFFVARLIRLPATLPVGDYSLKVTIVDPQADRLAERTLPLTIAAE